MVMHECWPAFKFLFYGSLVSSKGLRQPRARKQERAKYGVLSSFFLNKIRELSRVKIRNLCAVTGSYERHSLFADMAAHGYGKNHTLGASHNLGNGVGGHNLGNDFVLPCKIMPPQNQKQHLNGPTMIMKTLSILLCLLLLSS